VSLLLALLSSVLLGAADFTGGLVAKRTPAVTVVIWSNLAGLVTALLVAVTVLPGRPQPADVGWGALAGLAGSLGAVLLYRALASGVMMLAAPVAAVAAALLPVLVGVVCGARLRPLALAGVALAVVALALVSRGRRDPTNGVRRGSVRVTLGLALGAGLGFGAFMVLLSQTPTTSGLWPLVFARCASLSVLLVLAVATRRPVRVPPAAAGWCGLTGALDLASSLLYLLAVREGSLALVGLLASLSPVSTVLLARILLRERTWIWQRLGAGLALGSVLLLALA
jgi:drug/metabolite transporter (DMT)-like permease